MSVDRATVTHPDDAASLMHLMGFLLGDAHNGEAIWEWANGLSALHKEDPGVLSQLGTIGDSLRESPVSGCRSEFPSSGPNRCFGGRSNSMRPARETTCGRETISCDGKWRGTPSAVTRGRFG